MALKPSKELVEKELELSEEFLRDAKYLLEKDARRSASSRAYYSMFHAAKAILESLGESPKSHKGVISLFGERVVKEGLMDKIFGRYLSEGLSGRITSDYEFLTLPERKEIEERILHAEKFLNKVKEIIKEEK